MYLQQLAFTEDVFLQEDACSVRGLHEGHAAATNETHETFLISLRSFKNGIN
jgi:hypothetical protein